MSTSNRECVHCHIVVPYRKVLFKGILNRTVRCPSCQREQVVALPILLAQYVTLVSGLILMVLNTLFFKQLILGVLPLFIFLSCFLYEPFKKLVPER
ncbi:hypothetical protein [Alkalicoccobacillus murimartini]|uniref:CXXC-20-CXXC protein n=1 Tax=Alkalicoccobacillus murimartini TaxID=171685 RepID=A0ABT9YE97_9BACI|nr:hypothetical protein [Alkalicoccobacillus murimartini]MDQ0206162.1 hypothetical protein [Alkalicoccobacillus murimartini]